MADTRVRREMERLSLRPFTLDDFHSRRDRKRRNERIAAGGVGIAVFVAAMLIATGAIQTDTSTPSTGGPSGTTSPPPHPVGIGLIGLPPEGATPSGPQTGEIVLSFGFGHTGGDPGLFGLNVYADGRVIWHRNGGGPVFEGEPSTGWIEQRLTPEGVDLVQAEVLSTGFFDQDRELVGGIPYTGVITVRSGDRLVNVFWGVGVAPPEGSNPIETNVTSEDVEALNDLDARLEDLGSWLPPEAWADQEYRAWVPHTYLVCYGGTDEPLGRSEILGDLPTAVGDLLRAKDARGDGLRQPHGIEIHHWCSTVTMDEARQIGSTLVEAGAEVRSDLGPVYEFTPPGASPMAIDVAFFATLPQE
jgi:hypothetical protein